MSNADSDIELNTKALDQLIKAFGDNIPTIKIGVLGNGARSIQGKGSSPTNAEIGAAHEFGAPAHKLPMRSFLRMPLNTRLSDYMENAGLFKEQTIKDFIKTGSIETFIKLTGELALNVVRDAFETGGFGKWAKWKDPSYTNNSGMLLVDSHQLRDSISYEVK